jgi:hypothetical protein
VRITLRSRTGGDWAKVEWTMESRPAMRTGINALFIAAPL